jgi:hypothetical protein
VKRKLNPWVQYVYDQWFWAMAAWERDAEAASNGWATELAEWEETHPRPQFKHFMIELSLSRQQGAA